MKYKRYLIVFFIAVAAYCQTDAARFMGKWQQREESGSDGAHSYIIPVKDGPVIIFAQDSTVTYNGIKGRYILGEARRLTIDLGKDKYYYLAYFKNDTVMCLNPVTPEFQIICDEGCAYIYYKVSD